MKIVFLDEYTLGGTDLNPIKRLGEYTGYNSTQPGEVIQRAAEAEILIVNKIVIDEQTMAALPSLRLICVAATGTNNIDLAAAARRGIEVRNAVGYSTHTVVEATIGAALGLLRQIVYYDDYCHSGRYSASGSWVNFDRPTHSLHGRHWGIIGMGNIGREVASVAEAMGCEVAFTSASGTHRQSEKWPQLSLSELLLWADVLSVHSPLTDLTRGLLGRNEIGLMRPSSIVINVARGVIVDEQAVADALNANRLAGAAFDVYPTEPMSADSPLLTVADRYKLLLSPHNAWSAVESIEALVECIVRNISDFRKI
ncbi:MAG: NAD(P)-dependent oxidoreductase [Tidjanibacter sp.]|nr:NAD(P)-dependent oxidoreductase [Tidjanibacter sp.]